MLYRRSVSITAFALLALLLSTVPTIAQQGHHPQSPATPAASPVAASGWQTDAVAVVDVEGAPISLSPDGQWLAGIGPDRTLCVWEVATFEPTCDSVVLPIMENSIAWSPDSGAVAFTEDVFLRMDEGDIHVFELATGKSTNLTDDGLAGGLFDFQGNPSVPMDTMPTWSLDSQSLLFLRSDMGDAFETSTTDLMLMPRTGGEPELVKTLYDNSPLAIYTRMFPLADGSLVYALNPSDIGDPASGVWILAPDGTAQQVMATGPETDYPLPIITDVFEGNGTLMALGVSGSNVGQMAVEAPLAFVLDLHSGEVTPLEGDATTMQTPAQSAFAPDGATILSVLLGPVEGDQVMLTGAQQQEVDLGPGATSRSTGQARWNGPEWRAGNVVFVARGLLADPYLLNMEPLAGNP